ncbi:MAG: Cation diffusion facilitator family transporter [Rickettsiaceae bacterium]|jgi:cation diffusion facilitator family transporter|nr:Cation diffusion facilitator family transporter [Rickettsiaceae bacterium]
MGLGHHHSHNHNHSHSYNHNNNLLKIASYLSVANAFIIVAMKLYGWIITDSVSILASLIDACLDISASVVNLIAIRLAIQPPDDNHRFGHDKIEDLAVFAQSMFFGGSSVFLVFNSIKKFSEVSSFENYGTGIYIMIASTVLTTALVSFQSFVISRTKSTIIAADKLHYVTDLFTNIAVIASMYITSHYGFAYADPIFALIIATYILHNAYKLSIKAIKNLVDEEFSLEDRNRIIKIISKNTMIKGIHELKTRYAGNKPFIQCHLELDGSINLYEAHAITDSIMEELYTEFPGSEIMIHQDPAGVERNVPFKEKLPNV